MKRLAVLLALAGSWMALSAAPVAAEPFYCDGGGLSELASTNCGSTGVCYWEYLGGGMWLEKCLPYCEVYYCG